MRLLIDSLIAMMLVAVLAGIILHHRQQQRSLAEYQTLHRSLVQFQDALEYHAALGQASANASGYPQTISPLWFSGDIPVNRMVASSQPWLDIAPAQDMNDQPPDPVITHGKQAGFWYNPNRGIVRARVPRQFTEQATIELYNQLNGTMLIALSRSTDPSRQPVAYANQSADVESSKVATPQTPAVSERRTLRDTSGSVPMVTDTPPAPVTSRAQTLVVPEAGY